jgi:hypothetical protein
MKNLCKILLFSLLMVVVVSSQAQKVTLTETPTTDITVGTTGYASLNQATSGFKSVITFQTVITKVSGTVAGTATLQVSNDGTNYFAYPGAAVYTITDVATQTTGWVVAPSGFQYYRIALVNTTGTFSHVSTAAIRTLK